MICWIKNFLRKRRKPFFFVNVFYLPYEYLDNKKDLPKELQEEGSALYKRHRCWGFFKDFKLAERCIKENWTDIYEDGYYNLAMIEPVFEGVCPRISKCLEKWYKVNPILNEKVEEEQEELRKAGIMLIENFFDGGGKSKGWRVKDYEITEIERPARFKGLMGFSLG